MTDPVDLWILSVPARTADEVTALNDWLQEVCDAAPVEIELVERSLTWLESYFDDPATASVVRQALLTAFPSVEAEIRPCRARDWTTFWRHHFRPLSVGHHLRIVPEWMREDPDPEAEGRHVIWVNPGLSFGTGNHFTTRFCLETLDRLHREGFHPDAMFDAGCGSAILSIAARKFGWESILAVDHDPLSVDQARENLQLNQVEDGIDIRAMDLTRTWPEGTWPLVVANLYGGLLMELASRLVRCCSGTLVLSGIRAIEAEAVSSVFAQLGAREVASEADNEWCGLRFEL